MGSTYQIYKQPRIQVAVLQIIRYHITIRTGRLITLYYVA